jgi:hypothetical protein
VVTLQIVMYEQADVERGQHILDTFDADCELVRSYTPEPSPPSYDDPPSGGGDLDCSDFNTQEEAQAVFDADRTAAHALDRDRDGEACEELPRGPDPEPGPQGPVTGVIEKPEITIYQYGTHAITDEVSRARYALTSEERGLLDCYTGRRVTVHGTLVPGYDRGQVEGGPPLLRVTRVEPAQGRPR